MMIRNVALLLCSVVFIAADTAEKTTPETVKKEKAPRFTLMDSHDEPFGFIFPVDKPVLLTFADQGGHEQMDAWTEPLLERYGDRIPHRAVAWLEASPRLLRGTGENKQNGQRYFMS